MTVPWWSPPTLWDAIQGGEVAAESVWTFRQQVRPSMTVRAPCCGRKTPADTVLDLRGVSGTVFRPTRGPRRAAVDQPWACDACRTALTRQPGGAWPASRLWQVLGAPAHMVKDNEAREELRRRRRAHFATPKGQRAAVMFDPGAEMAKIKAAQ